MEAKIMPSPNLIPTSDATGTSLLVSIIHPAQSYFLEQSLTSTNISPKLLIGRNPHVCGNAPIIIGTRISVHQLVELVDELGWGWDLEKIITAYPHLTPVQIEAAQLYYEDHHSEIETRIQEEKEAENDV